MTPAEPRLSSSGRFAALHCVVEILTDRSDLGSWIASSLSPLRTAREAEIRVSIETAAAGQCRLRVDGTAHGPDLAPPRVLPTLMALLNQWAIASVPTHVVLHAAVVALDGGAALLVGPSGSGKSTLAATLASMGVGYGGDELAAVSLRDQQVLPYAKPIALKRGAGTERMAGSLERPPLALREFFEHQRYLGPSERRGADLTRPLDIRAIVLPTFRPGAEAAVVPLTRASVVMRLRAEAFNFARDRERALRSLARLVRGAPSLGLVYGDGAAAWDTLLTTLREGSLRTP